MNFYRLVWEKGSNTCSEYLLYNGTINCYNVVFNNLQSSVYRFFYPKYESKFVNCTITQKWNNLLGKTMRLTNCYGGFTSGYGTSDSDWNYQTNRIVNSPLLSSTYQITEAENVWKNKGTGTNPDGTKANLGVYGGTYSWAYNDDIFQ